jgi:hypothetical protein
VKNICIVLAILLLAAVSHAADTTFTWDAFTGDDAVNDVVLEAKTATGDWQMIGIAKGGATEIKIDLSKYFAPGEAIQARAYSVRGTEWSPDKSNVVTATVKESLSVPANLGIAE